MFPTAQPDAFEIRRAEVGDSMAAWLILTDYWPVFGQDDLEISPPWLLSLIQSGALWAVVLDARVVGLLWLSDIHPERLFGSLHFLLLPACLRRALRQRLFCRVLAHLFGCYGVLKIKVAIKPCQTVGLKLLKHHGFKQVATLKNETRVKGQLTSVLLFELHRNYWEKKYDEFWKEKGKTG